MFPTMFLPALNSNLITRYYCVMTLHTDINSFTLTGDPSPLLSADAMLGCLSFGSRPEPSFGFTLGGGGFK